MAGIDSRRLINIANSLKATSRDHANLEAEKGETVVTDLGGNGLPQLYNIEGKPHSRGGTPLNLPDSSFIFSKDKSMRIDDKFILERFGVNPNKKHTPAEISKKFELNKYHQILLDPMSSDLERKTAERMIANNSKRLAELSLVQESIKGFDNGVPDIAKQYLMNHDIEPQEIFDTEYEEVDEAPMMKRGGQNKKALPKFEKGGDKKKVTYRKVGDYNIPSSIPEDATMWDISQDSYKEALANGEVSNGDYLFNPETGKWTVIKSRPLSKGGFEDKRLGKLQGAYSHLNTALDSEGVAEDLATVYRDIIRESKDISTNQKNRLLALDDDQIMEIFKEGQKQVYSIDANSVLRGEDGELKSDLSKWDRGKANVEYNKVMKELGFEAFDEDQIKAFQSAYHAFQDIAKSDEHKDKFKNFKLSPIGLDDQIRDGKPVSPIDGIFGNTTAGQAVLPLNMNEDFEEDVALPKEAEEVVNDLESGATINDIEAKYNTQDSPWWLQDIINTAGAMKDWTDIKKRSPWQAVANVQPMNPTYLDPTRQIAAIQEVAGQGADAAATYGGANAFNSRFSGIQSNAASNIANIVGQYDNQNVQIANQFEQANKQLMNEASMRKAAMDTQLFDKQTVADQQYDNEKKQAEQMIRMQVVNGITNAKQTQAMNLMYPQFAVTPGDGGGLVFENPMELVAGSGADPYTIDKEFKDIKRDNPYMSNSDIIDLLKLKYKSDIETSKESRLDKQQTQADPRYMGYPGRGGGQRRAAFGGESQPRKLVRIKF